MILNITTPLPSPPPPFFFFFFPQYTAPRPVEIGKDTGHTVDSLGDGIQHLVLTGHVLLCGNGNTVRQKKQQNVIKERVKIKHLVSQRSLHTHTKTTTKHCNKKNNTPPPPQSNICKLHYREMGIFFVVVKPSRHPSTYKDIPPK